MKIKVTRPFTYTWDHDKDHTLQPGEYEVPRNVSKRTAELAIQFGAAVIVPTKKTRARKKAPENKAAKVKETK